jgi:hypothetical protein
MLWSRGARPAWNHALRRGIGGALPSGSFTEMPMTISTLARLIALVLARRCAFSGASFTFARARVQ